MLESELNSINLLAREGENGLYEFTHQTWQEYFCARYLAEAVNSGKLTIEEINRTVWSAPFYTIDGETSMKGPADFKDIQVYFACALNPNLRNKFVDGLSDLYLNPKYMSHFHSCMRGDTYRDFLSVVEIITKIGTIEQIMLLLDHEFSLVGDVTFEDNVISFDNVEPEVIKLCDALRQRDFSEEQIREEIRKRIDAIPVAAVIRLGFTDKARFNTRVPFLCLKFL